MKSFLKYLMVFALAFVIGGLSIDISYAGRRQRMLRAAESYHQALARGDRPAIGEALSNDFIQDGYGIAVSSPQFLTKKDMVNSRLWPIPQSSRISIEDSFLSYLFCGEKDSVHFYLILISEDKPEETSRNIWIPVTYTFEETPDGLKIKHIEHHAIFPFHGFLSTW